MKKVVGRPTSYTDEMPNQVLNYIENYKDNGDIIPSVVGLASVIGVTSKTIILWRKDDDKKEFCLTLEILEDKQHQALVNGGLSSTFNSTITKLALHNHGYSDKTESKVSADLNVKEFNDMYDAKS